MRPGASRLCLAAALAFAAIGLSREALAAPPGGFSSGTLPAVSGNWGRVRPIPRDGRHLPSPRARSGWAGAAEPYLGRRKAGFRSRVAYGRLGRGFGFGTAIFGPPYLAGAWYDGGWGPAILERHTTIKLEWPTSIGIPPSPVQPPAIYVIGGERRSASVLRRGGRRAVVTQGSPGAGSPSGRIASGPVFIPVPGGR